MTKSNTINFDSRFDLVADLEGLRHAASGTGTIMRLIGGAGVGLLMRNASVEKIDAAVSRRVAELAHGGDIEALRAYLRNALTPAGRAAESGWIS